MRVFIALIFAALAANVSSPTPMGNAVLDGVPWRSTSVANSPERARVYVGTGSAAWPARGEAAVAAVGSASPGSGASFRYYRVRRADYVTSGTSFNISTGN